MQECRLHHGKLAAVPVPRRPVAETWDASPKWCVEA